MTSDDPLRFSTLPLRAELLRSLDAVGHVRMSPIQAAVMTPLLAGRDLLAQAETGSGKTAAFAIGLLQVLDATRFATQALVVCPTRELGDQVAGEIRRLAGGLANTKVLTLCGGQPMREQRASLERDPHVVVGTPGRLKAHLDAGTLRLGELRTLVLDEADRMLDMGFHDDIMGLLEHVGPDRQTLLFSATYPDTIGTVSRAVQVDPVEIRLEAADTPARIEQRFVLTSDERRTDTLLRVLARIRPERALIFCNRRSRVQSVREALGGRGIVARALHGDLDQRERDEAVMLFANRSVSCLVATDVAARGLDIDALPAVIVHDLSPDPETHVHRIGRTGRAGAAGLAISLASADDEHRVRAIERYLGVELPFVEPETLGAAEGRMPAPATRTLRINVGKKDKIRPGDVVGALTADSGLTNDDLGRITVRAKASFVAVDAAVATRALEVLSGGRIKKRVVRARFVG